MQVTMQEANAAIGSVDSAYNGILLKGFYLPKRTSSLITTDYLLKVMINKVFRIKLVDVKIGQLIQNTNSSTLLNSLLQINVEKPWGFDQDHLPDKSWMINILFTLKPHDKLFKCSINECLSILTPEDLKIIQSFNTSYCRQTQGRFFKRSKTQSIEYKQKMIQLKDSNKKNKLNSKKQRIINLTKQIQELEAEPIYEEHQD